MSVDRSTEERLRGEGFAFFRWACLTTEPELTSYPGLIVKHIWAFDWKWRDFRRVVSL